jgi:protein-tyrosine phosphatase
MIWITEQVATSGAEITPDDWLAIFAEYRFSAVLNMRAEHQDHFAPPLPTAYLWLPVKDFTDPTPDQMLIGSLFIDQVVQSGGRVLIHCNVGIGRSPTMAAAYLVWTGLPVKEAIQLVEEAGKGPYGPVIRKDTIKEFAALLKSRREKKGD